MEPYRKSYRRKLHVFEPIKPEWESAPAPLDKRELRALGYIGTGPCVEADVAGSPLDRLVNTSGQPTQHGEAT
jgi:hypothetical protein